LKILIIGANGQLGTDLVTILRHHQLAPLTHREIEVCDYQGTRNILEEYKPQVIINTSAYHRVDLCEDYLEETFKVNTYAVRNLAKICQDLGSVLVHLSTDYVFGGERKSPYREEDLPHPLNVYGVSKLAGEYFVRQICQRHFLIRTSGLYGVAGASGKGGNFVELMIRLAQEEKPIKVVKDQILTPTYTKELAKKIAQLIETGEYGLYHVTNNGQCSWYEFARAIFEMVGLHPDLSATTSEEFGAQAKRSHYSVLENAHLRKIGLDNLSSWRKALGQYLREKGHLK
jgi:dTDP-4-dehydrorhamnose reductase